LGTNTTGARRLRKEVRLGANSIEVQTKERNGLLCETSQGWSLSGIPGDHSEVVGENGGLAGLVREEIVGHRATRNELKGAVCVLEVQLREPLRRLVLLNSTGGAFRFAKIIRGRDFDPEVRTTNDPVDVSSNSARAYNRVGTFNDENGLANEEVSPCGRCESEQNKRREGNHNEGRRGSG